MSTRKDDAVDLIEELRSDRRISSVEASVLRSGMDGAKTAAVELSGPVRSLRDLFDALGGPAAVGRIIGKGTEHAHSMKTRGSVPIAYWPKLIVGCRETGMEMDADRLLAIHLASIDVKDRSKVVPSADTSGRRLAELRNEKGFTQQSVADAVGAHWITVSRIERGTLKLTYEWAVKFAKALDVKVTDIFDLGEATG